MSGANKGLILGDDSWPAVTRALRCYLVQITEELRDEVNGTGRQYVMDAIHTEIMSVKNTLAILDAFGDCNG